MDKITEETKFETELDKGTAAHIHEATESNSTNLTRNHKNYKTKDGDRGHWYLLSSHRSSESSRESARKLSERYLEELRELSKEADAYCAIGATPINKGDLNRIYEQMKGIIYKKFSIYIFDAFYHPESGDFDEDFVHTIMKKDFYDPLDRKELINILYILEVLIGEREAWKVNHLLPFDRAPLTQSMHLSLSDSQIKDKCIMLAEQLDKFLILRILVSTNPKRSIQDSIQKEQNNIEQYICNVQGLSNVFLYLSIESTIKRFELIDSVIEIGLSLEYWLFHGSLFSLFKFGVSYFEEWDPDVLGFISYFINKNIKTPIEELIKSSKKTENNDKIKLIIQNFYNINSLLDDILNERKSWESNDIVKGDTKIKGTLSNMTNNNIIKLFPKILLLYKIDFTSYKEEFDSIKSFDNRETLKKVHDAIVNRLDYVSKTINAIHHAVRCEFIKKNFVVSLGDTIFNISNGIFNSMICCGTPALEVLKVIVAMRRAMQVEHEIYIDKQLNEIKAEYDAKIKNFKDYIIEITERHVCSNNQQSIEGGDGNNDGLATEIENPNVKNKEINNQLISVYYEYGEKVKELEKEIQAIKGGIYTQHESNKMNPKYDEKIEALGKAIETTKEGICTKQQFNDVNSEFHKRIDFLQSEISKQAKEIKTQKLIMFIVGSVLIIVLVVLWKKKILFNQIKSTNTK